MSIPFRDLLIIISMYYISNIACTSAELDLRNHISKPYIRREHNIGILTADEKERYRQLFNNNDNNNAAGFVAFFDRIDISKRPGVNRRGNNMISLTNHQVYQANAPPVVEQNQYVYSTPPRVPPATGSHNNHTMTNNISDYSSGTNPTPDTFLLPGMSRLNSSLDIDVTDTFHTLSEDEDDEVIGLRANNYELNEEEEEEEGKCVLDYVTHKRPRFHSY